jgi:hypothetical protein
VIQIVVGARELDRQRQSQKAIWRSGLTGRDCWTDEVARLAVVWYLLRLSGMAEETVEVLTLPPCGRLQEMRLVIVFRWIEW